MMNRMLSQCALGLVNSWAGSSFLSSIESRDRRDNVLRVITYHRVDVPSENPHLYPGVHSATPDQFAAQLDQLDRCSHIVSLDEVLSALEGGHRLPAKSVLITFDDAYQNFETAWQHLKSRGLPVVLFVPTSFPDHPERTFWWDRVHWAIQSTSQTTISLDGDTLSLEGRKQKSQAARWVAAKVKQLPHREAMPWIDVLCQDLQEDARPNEVLSWQRLRELSEEGVTIGAHTHTHPLMNQITLDEARDEATRSREELEQRLGKKVRSFCYPAGGVSDEVAAMLREIGYTAAFTTQRGVNDLSNCDAMRLNRINVGGRTSTNVMRMQFLTYARNLKPEQQPV
ncbi:polysaccharide deacetylase family protein [Bremerella sp. JC770]|uniref:polysaccharide deacetylase family protein n=1 Tax=Bremerella sp. JC770 TaxID=3232137 RepID=UPI00345864C6